MTKEEAKAEIMQTVDKVCKDLSIDDYCEVLDDTISDLEGYRDAAEGDK